MVACSPEGWEPSRLTIELQKKALQGAEIQGLQLRNHAAIHPGTPRFRWRMELGWFEQGQNVGGSG